MKDAINFRITLMRNQLNKAKEQKELADNDFVRGLHAGEIIQAELAIKLLQELLVTHETLEQSRKAQLERLQTESDAYYALRKAL